MIKHIKFLTLAVLGFAVFSALQGCEPEPVMPATTCNLCEFTQP